MPPPNPFVKQYLMTAGPTPVPPAVMNAMAEPVTYHRSPAFDPISPARRRFSPRIPILRSRPAS